MARNAQGFTLVEVMIVVVIIAILSAIAIPGYADYVTRGRVIEATGGLGDARNKMEQFYQDNRAYPTGCVIAPAAPGPTQVQLQQLQYFALACAFPAANQFVVTATGIATGPMNGFAYTINEQNVKTSGPFAGTGNSKGWNPATPNTCWVLRKGPAGQTSC
jgi:type IV pilus assembly protein PilE